MTSENFSTLVQGLIAAAQLDISPGENVASLSVDDDILVSRVLDTTSLDGERLAAEMMLVIDAATSLRKAIEELCHEEGEEQAEPAFFSPEERA